MAPSKGESGTQVRDLLPLAQHSRANGSNVATYAKKVVDCNCTIFLQQNGPSPKLLLESLYPSSYTLHLKRIGVVTKVIVSFTVTATPTGDLIYA